MAYLWLEVTNDEKELPLAVADTQDELAKMMGITRQSVQRREENTRNGTNRGNKIIKVQI